MSKPSKAPASEIIKTGTIRSILSHLGSFFGSLFSSLLRGVLYWKESTILLPLAIGLLCLICLVVILVTGRQLLNDIGSLVDDGQTYLRIAIICALVGWYQKSLFGYRTESGGVSANPKLADDIHDSCVTAFLLLLFSALVFYF